MEQDSSCNAHYYSLPRFLIAQECLDEKPIFSQKKIAVIGKGHVCLQAAAYFGQNNYVRLRNTLRSF